MSEVLPVRHRGLLIVAIMGATTIQFLDATIANVALPHMQSSLGATFESVSWVLTSFIIAVAVTTPIIGWLADQFGARRLFLLAVGGFLVTSMLCGAAANLPEMIIARILQGSCAAIIGPLSQTVLLDISEPAERPRMMTIWGLGVLIAPVSGPVLGGILTESYSWRWVFYVNLPIGLPALALLWWLLPDTPARPRRFDLFGFLAFALALGAMQLMLDRGQQNDWLDSWETIIQIIIFASAMWVFLVHYFTHRAPLFERGLFLDRNYLTALGFMLLIGLVVVAIAAILPPMMEALYGYPVVTTGMLMAPRGVGLIVTTALAPLLMKRIGARAMVAAGFSIIAISLWMMTGWTLQLETRDIVLSGVVQGLGLGLVFMPLNILAFATLPARLRTDAASLLNLMRNVGASVGISILVTLLSRNTQINHAELVERLTPFGPIGVDPGLIGQAGGTGVQAALLVNAELTRQASMIAYLNDFKLMAIAVMCFIPLAFWLREPDLTGRSGTPGPQKAAAE